MCTCSKWLIPIACWALCAVASAQDAEPVTTPYGPSRLPFTLYRVPGAPVYYVIGRSGVPNAENEGHTSNAGFVFTDAGVVVFDALGTPELGHRLSQRIREVTNTERWLRGLDYLSNLQPSPRFVIPGHGKPSEDVQQAVTATRGYINYLRDTMRQAAADFVTFDEAYDATDWSMYEDMPAFDASNRGNAYRIYLEMEANSFQ